MVRISFITCVFLIGLRLVIGWHFFFEGVSKYESLRDQGAVTSKPFSSAGYFNEAEGPLGPTIRNFIGDEDARAIAKLTPAAPDKMPSALESEWDAYANQFTAYFHLDDADRRSTQDALNKAKRDYVDWLAGKQTKQLKKIKKKVLSTGPPVEYEADDDVPARTKDYKVAVEKVRDFYDYRLRTFGNVDKTTPASPASRALKTEAAAMRTDLMKDVDEHTKKMKDDLAETIRPKLACDFGKLSDPAIDERVLAMITPRDGKADPGAMPEAIARQWDAYYALLKEAGHNELRHDPDRGDAILADAKLIYVRYLNDQDADGHPRGDGYVDARRTAYQKAVEKLKKVEEDYSNSNSILAFCYVPAIADAMVEPVRLRQSFIDAINSQTENLKKRLGGFSDDGYKGIAPVQKPKTVVLGRDFPGTRLGWLDWLTRWMVLSSGACLLAGLLTRLACLSCISFLVIEYLSNPPFPWLPVSPKSEGNYLFVNKNVVELVALLVLLTLPTGRWFGLDAILSRLCPFGCRRKR